MSRDEAAGIEYKLIRSARRTLAIEIRRDGNVIVRAPLRAKFDDINLFVNEKAGWIERHVAAIRSRPETQRSLSAEEIKTLKKQIRPVLSERVKYYASVLGVSYGTISIRAQKTLWGSCNKYGDLSFNCLLCLLPPCVLDYVVVHELCHRKQMNHSAAFWREVERVLPDYKSRRAQLKKEAAALLARLP